MSQNSDNQVPDQSDSASGISDSETTESSPQREEEEPTRVNDTSNRGDGVASAAGSEIGDTGVDMVGLNMPMPSKKWKFNSFLCDLADEINSEELVKLKHMFIELIGRRVLEKIETPRDLFDTLRKEVFMREDNLLYLQSILLKLKRPGLIKMAIEYAESAGDVIHFQPAPEQPANGFRSIKVHVEGKDFKSCNRTDVTNLRVIVSDLLCIPMTHVIVAGIEPSSSMLLTIWIPDVYADILEEMLDSNHPLPSLCEVEIDTLQIGNKTYNITGIENVEIVETEQQTKLISVYQQLQDKTMQLENMELVQIETSEENENLRQQIADLKTEFVPLSTMFYNSSDGNVKRPAKLGSQSAFELFKRNLSQLKVQNCDKKAIQDLLFANSAMITQRSAETFAYKIDELVLQVKQLQSQLLPLSFEIEFHRINNSGELEMMLKTMLQQLLQSIEVPRQIVEQTLTYYGNSILRSISQKIKLRERQKLEGRYKWKPNDKLTQYKKDPSLLLSCLFYKEIETTKKPIDFNTFVEKCLKEINRKDLLHKFKEMISQPPTPEQKQKRSSSASHSEERETPSSPKESSIKVEKEIHEILERVSRIDDTIQSVKNASVPYGTSEDKVFPPGTSLYGGAFMRPRQVPVV